MSLSGYNFRNDTLQGQKPITFCAYNIIFSQIFSQTMATVIGQMTCVVVFLGALHPRMTPLCPGVRMVLL